MLTQGVQFQDIRSEEKGRRQARRKSTSQEFVTVLARALHQAQLIVSPQRGPMKLLPH